MNFMPKAGPLVAELLSGVSALLIFYCDFYGLSFKTIDELTSGAIVVLAILAWILGTFFDLIRNLLEYVWDCRRFTLHELNWAFFFRGDETRLANLEHYFWSFYLLDADMAIAILLSLAASPCIVFVSAGAVRGKMWLIWSALLVVALMFANDARLLRHEIKALLDAEPK
jgi:hypothetical protein